MDRTQQQQHKLVCLLQEEVWWLLQVQENTSVSMKSTPRKARTAVVSSTKVGVPATTTAEEDEVMQDVSVCLVVKTLYVTGKGVSPFKLGHVSKLFPMV